jgi:hypothetical protein
MEKLEPNLFLWHRLEVDPLETRTHFLQEERAWERIEPSLFAPF